MKRKLAALLALLMCATLLTGFHGGTDLKAFVKPDTFDESRQYTISFWAKNDTNKTQVDIYKKAIADFEALYPNIKVNLKLYTDYAVIYNDVITNISTGTTPNVCISYPDHIATYLTGRNIMVPLDGLMADGKYGLGGSALKYEGPAREEMVDKFLQEGRIGGGTYALPFMRSTEACYVNKNLVEKLGYELPEVLTWDFIFKVSEEALAQNEDGTYKINGQKVMIPFIYKSTDNMMITMLKQKGAGYSDDQGSILMFNDTTRELLYEIGEHGASKAFSTFKIDSYPGNFLNAGQCIFAIDSTAGATWMGTDAPLMDIPEKSVVRFTTAVLPVPQEDPEQLQMISQGPSVCIFNKEDPQEVMASWIFAQFLLTNGVQIAYAQTEGYVPVTLKAQNSVEYQQYLSLGGTDNGLHYSVKIDATKLLLAHTEDTFITPVFNGSASLREAAGSLIESVVKSRRRKQTVDEAYMEKLFADTANAYHLDWDPRDKEDVITPTRSTEPESGETGQETEPGTEETRAGTETEPVQEETRDSDRGPVKDLGPLPGTARALLYCLAGAWGLILLVLLWRFLAEKKKKN